MSREGNLIIDQGFLNNKRKYVFQCSIAFLVLLASLLLLNVFKSGVVIASIGATAVLIFSAPHKERARTRYIIGGYTIGILTGALCHLVATNVHRIGTITMHTISDEIFGALSVGLSMFLMVIFDFEHPPAAAVSLGLVLYPWEWVNVVFTMVAIALIICARYLLRNRLIDLM